MSDKNLQPAARRYRFATTKLSGLSLLRQKTELTKLCSAQSGATGTQRRVPEECEWKKKNKEDVEYAKEIVQSRGLDDAQLFTDIELQRKVMDNGYNILKDALWHGYEDVAKALLKLNTRVNKYVESFEETNHADTPLHLAARSGYKDITELLLANDGNVNARNRLGQTPLHVAVLGKQIEVIKVLLCREKTKLLDHTKWTDYINARDDTKKTALHYMICGGYCNSDNLIQIITLLLSVGFCKSTTRQILYSAVTKGQIGTVKALLEGWADVNIFFKDGRTLLMLSVLSGNLVMTLLFLKKGVQVNAMCREIVETPPKKRQPIILCERSNCDPLENCSKKTALHFAAVKGENRIISALLDHGANINCVDHNGKTPLYLAMEVGQDEVVFELLKRGANANLKCGLKKGTALHYAVAKGSKDIVTVLLDNGADIYCKDSDGKTVLHDAVERDDKALVDLFLARGADANLTDAKGCTSLHCCQGGGTASVLLSHGANVNCKDREGKTPLHLAAKNGLLQIAVALLDHKSEVNPVDTYKNTPLYYAAANGCVDTVSVLLKSGAEVDHHCENGRTALHVACALNHKDIVLAILKHGPKVNSPDEKGRTPLFHALKPYLSYFISCESDPTDNKCIIFDFLLKNGADINWKDNVGNTPLQRAVAKGLDDAALALVSRGSDVTSKNHNTGKTVLHTAIEQHCKNTVLALLDHGAINLKQSTDNGDTALHLAAKYGDKDIILALLNRGLDVNSKNCTGKTALHVAAKNNRRQRVLGLLKNGAEVNSKDYKGRTALHLAAASSFGAKTAVALLNAGADADCKDNTGFTPLVEATINDQLDVVSTLLEWGCDIDATYNKIGRTALYEATRKGNVEIVSTLLQYGADCTINFDLISKKLLSFSKAVSPSAHARWQQPHSSMSSEIEARLWKHVIVLGYLDISVHEIYKQCVGYNSESVKEIRKKCDEEWELIRKDTDRLRIHKKSSCDVLTLSRNDLCHYLSKNKTILHSLKSKDYESAFPMFQSMINVRLRMAEKRLPLLDEATVLMFSLFRSPPGLCINELTDYLSNTDLRNFVKAFQ